MVVPVIIAVWLSFFLLLYFVIIPFAQGYGIRERNFDFAFAPFLASDETARFFLTMLWPVLLPVSLLYALIFSLGDIGNWLTQKFRGPSITNYFREKGSIARKKND